MAGESWAEHLERARRLQQLEAEAHRLVEMAERRGAPLLRREVPGHLAFYVKGVLADRRVLAE